MHDPDSAAAGDRLSRLDDAALGHILSFLPAAEAARAAALSRRWWHAFAAVHSLSFREAEPPLSMGYQWFKIREQDPNVRAPLFVTGVAAALLGRDRGAAAAPAPLRALRVAFDEYSFLGGDARKAVDSWLSYAAQHAAGDDLEIDLRLHCGPVCERKYALVVDTGGGDQPPEPTTMDDDHDMEPPLPPAAAAGEPNPGPTEYITPKSLFSCDPLRILRLGGCWLDLPSSIALPSLATLHLARVTGRNGAVQRLVTACPRLADLTLEACGGGNLTELSVPGSTARLRRLALRCCHDLAAVAVADSSELRAFEYPGAVPGPRFLSMKYPPKIKLCTLDFCGEEPAAAPELGFLQLFSGVERLHLTSARLGCGIIGQPHPVASATEFYANGRADEEAIHAAHKLRHDRHATLAVPGGVDIPACLRERIREMNLVHYQGAMAQRMLARFLLGNAPVVTEVCCEFARGPLPIQTKLMEEMKGWVMNKSANMMFL
ncbi:unnamed protein product [Urochloa decumbens]|uniref:F-box/LRR-repeat protein 15/At3g58940/PEG3-like LRR domain-containing protein n=1 Tax=Urochloa decumbens TaxID=240449 RepID=A0ABC9AKS7_9POAL